MRVCACACTCMSLSQLPTTTLHTRLQQYKESVETCVQGLEVEPGNGELLAMKKRFVRETLRSKPNQTRIVWSKHVHISTTHIKMLSCVDSG